MIELKSLKFKNIFQFGNEVQHLDVENIDSAVIQGKNGLGKSTIYEALCFNWYGKAYRKNMKVAQLINDINQADLWTETVFIKDKKTEYRLVRGLKNTITVKGKSKKTDIFDIYKNGSDTPELKENSNPEFQKTINKILGASFDVFKQLCIIDSQYYTPFLELGASGKREIRDRLFDLVDVELANQRLKDKRKIVVPEIEQLNIKVTTLSEKIRVNEEFAKSKSEERLKEIEQRNVELREEYSSLSSNISSLESQVIDVEELNNQISAGERFNDIQISKKGIEQANKEISTITVVNEDHLNKVISSYNANLEATQLENSMNEIVNKIEQLKSSVKRSLADITKSGDETKGKIAEHQATLKRNQVSIEGLKNNFCDHCLQNIDKAHADKEITRIDAENESSNQSIIELNNNLESFKTEYVETKKITDEISSAELQVNNVKSQIESVKVNIIEDVSSITENDIISYKKSLQDSVGYKADIELKQREIAGHQKVIDDIGDDYKEVDVDNLKVQLSTANNTNTGIHSQIAVNKSKLKDITDEGTTNKSEIESINNQKENTDVAEYKTELEKVKIESNDKERELEVIDESIKITSDKEVKSYLIKNKLPSFNKRLKEYSVKLGQRTNFKFDENFEEKIDPRFRNSRPFNSLSAGLRHRVSASILFAMLEETEKKSKTKYNFIFFDESLDSNGLDYEGKKDMIRIIKNDINKKVFATSHDVVIKSNFERCFTVKQKGAFVTISEDGAEIEIEKE